MSRKTKKIKIEIIKDVYWEDWGTPRKVFRKGWVGYVDGHYVNGNLMAYRVKALFTKVYLMKFGMTVMSYWRKNNELQSSSRR